MYRKYHLHFLLSRASMYNKNLHLFSFNQPLTIAVFLVSFKRTTLGTFLTNVNCVKWPLKTPVFVVTACCFLNNTSTCIFKTRLVKKEKLFTMRLRLGTRGRDFSLKPPVVWVMVLLNFYSFPRSW